MQSEKRYTIEDFIVIVRRLRSECPWDRDQTHMSIRHSLIEETYEFIESVDNKDFDEMKKELGDLLLHIVLHSVMAEETRSFTLDDVVTSIAEKMIRRHPHVFGTTEVENAEDVKRNWERIKLQEGRTSVIDGVPKEMPALLQAQRIQEKASKVGFDWAKKSDVWKKVEEELVELHDAEKLKDQKKIDDEFGDVLFSLVNYARFLDVDAELSLRSAIKKFSERFHFVEEELRRRGKQPGSVPLEEMDDIWNQYKTRQRE